MVRKALKLLRIWSSSQDLLTLGVGKYFPGPGEWLASAYHLPELRTGHVTVLRYNIHYSVRATRSEPQANCIVESLYSFPGCHLCLSRLRNFSLQVENYILFSLSLPPPLPLSLPL